MEGVLLRTACHRGKFEAEGCRRYVTLSLRLGPAVHGDREDVHNRKRKTLMKA